jgi:tetratricopeptide (TPR) repeat protein
MLSHMLSGRRIPGGRQAVVALSRTLEMSRSDTDQLLASLDYSRLTDAEVTAAMLERHVYNVDVEALPEPERELLAHAIDRDLRLMGASWRHYIDLRDELQRRNWQNVALGAEAGRANYRELLAGASRFVAWLELSDAEANQYQGRFEEAKAACRRGLAASQVSGGEAVRCLLSVKLGDIHKLLGDFTASDEQYLAGQQILQDWRRPAEVERRFIRHWQARIQREQGNLLLFMALPTEAEPLLRQSYEHFESQGNKYDMARVSHSLAWAAHLLGDWDGSFQWRQQAFELGRKLDLERGWEDPLSALQDNLYLGLLLEDEGDYESSEEKLLNALAVPTMERPSWQYHEAGLVYVALSRIYRASWRKHNLAQAEWHARQGLDFYESAPTKDPMRLAIAYNAYGDLLLDQDRPHEARIAFEQALIWSQTSNPPNRYYEAAARLRVARAAVAELRSESRQHEATQLTLHLEERARRRTPARPTTPTPTARQMNDLLKRAESELAKAEETSRLQGHWHLLARLKLVTAMLRLWQSDTKAASSLSWEAIEASLHVNRFVFRQTWSAVENLGFGPSVLASVRTELRRRLNGVLPDVDSMTRDRELPGEIADLLKREARTSLRSTPDARAQEGEQ